MRTERKDNVLSCKVSDEMRQRLEKIREDYGFKSIYELLQALVTVFVRNVTADVSVGGVEEDEARRMFSGFSEQARRMNITGNGREAELALTGGVLFFSDQSSGSMICKTIRMSKGKAYVDYSDDRAVTEVLHVADAKLYERLRSISEQLHERRLTRVLEYMAGKWKSRIAAECEEEFTDEEFGWINGGGRIIDNTKGKRKEDTVYEQQ